MADTNPDRDASARTSPEASPQSRVRQKKPEAARRGGGRGCIAWIAGAVILALVGYALYARFREEEPPPPPRKTFTVAASDFYLAYLESVESVAKAKALFYRGRGLLGGKAETLPESAGSQEASPLFQAAESFALAMEQIEHAEDLLKTDTVGLKPHERECRELLRENLEKYRAAVKIFNEYAKAQYQESEAKAEKFALSDGNAKWTMAETLMSKYLGEGCQGEFFIHVQDQKPEFRRRAMQAYRDFYGDGFEGQRTMFSLLMAYPGPPEGPPLPSPASIPTKVFQRSSE